MLEAQTLQGVPDGVTEAKGGVRMGQGELRLDAPALRYDAARSLVFIEGGGVRWARERDRLQGESGEFDLDRSVGEFRQPFFFCCACWMPSAWRSGTRG